MQRCLIDHRAGEKRVTVLFQRDGQTIKPFGPPVIQVPLDADFIALMLVLFFIEYLFVTHQALRVFPFVVYLPKGYRPMW